LSSFYELRAAIVNCSPQWEELAEMLPTLDQIPQAGLTKEVFSDLFARAVKETEAGVVVHQAKIIIVVGKKPLQRIISL
jgi:hypothetical protein